MINRLCTASVIALLAATAPLAVAHDEDVDCELCARYRAQELSLDVFGTAALGKDSLDDLSGETIDEDTEWGVGIGLNYFFIRWLGVGADAYLENSSGAFVDSASLNLIGRFPIGDSGFAPNVFGGGGCLFDNDELWFWQFGAGIEYRFTQNIGVFLDARWVMPEEIDDYGVARLGVRFAF